MIDNIRNYIQLTKPSIMLLVLISGATALVWEGSLLNEPLKFLLIMVALYLTGGSANALNQYFERDIDSKMKRTSKRRPLPTGKISPQGALIFSIAIGLFGVFIFAFWFNWIAASLSLVTILFYSLFYTLFLKPNTAQNIVIGGAAGAMAPVGAWAAASGQMAVAPWLLFTIVFLWTPPHFWALALYCKDDYIKAKLPMMPVVKGDKSTLLQILVYSIFLVLVSIIPYWYGVGFIYLVSAILLGITYLRKTILVMREPEVGKLRALFGFSILYLFGLFIAIIIDVLV